MNWRRERLSTKSKRRYWLVVIVVLTVVLVAINELATHYWLAGASTGLWSTFGSLTLVALGGLAYLVIDRSYRWNLERDQLSRRIESLERTLETSNKRQQAIFQINRMFASAQEESEVIDLILRLSLDVIGAKGASYVPLDERSQPLSAMTTGVMPMPEADAWLEYLASPQIRERCGSCQEYESIFNLCPLLVSGIPDGVGMYCIPLRRGKQEYGVLNLYIPETETLSEDTKDFLHQMISETSSALDSLRLRDRELNALRQMQAVRDKKDIHSQINDFLKNLYETMDLDFALVKLQDQKLEAGYDTLVWGEAPRVIGSLIDSLTQAVMRSEEPVFLGDVGAQSQPSKAGYALMVLPLKVSNQPAMGALIAGSRNEHSFSLHQRSIIQTLAGQLSLVLHNVNSFAGLEYKIIMEERSRLAREIHDGLAQTLGFLKLKMAQMKSFLDYEDYEQVRETLPDCYQAVSDAYLDARQSIDGLRISDSSKGVSGWLPQTVEEFEENSGLKVDLELMGESTELPPEVHAQLVRIVQEALNNIRKHAMAKHVWLSYCQDGMDHIFEIRDDGRGFDVDDIGKPSQHGLQGMRERTELIGGEFQVIGRPQEGTIVRIRFPMVVGENVL